MKKFKKLVACTLALSAVCGTYAEIAPHTETLNAAQELVKMDSVASFKVEGLPHEAKVGETITLKSVAEVGADSVSVKDFYGNSVDVASGSFAITKACDYIITYTKGTGVDSVSQSFVVKVSGKTQALEFTENAPQFIPNEMYVKQKAVLPAPSNMDEGTTYEVFANGTKITATQEISGKNYFVFNPQTAGTYSIRYTATVNGQSVNKTDTINVVNENAYGLDIDVEKSKEMPKTAEAGVEVELPKFTTHNKKDGNAALDNYTDVKVKYYKTDGTSVDVPVKDFKFTPEFLADGTSYYEITYTINTVHSLFGNTKAEAIVKTFQLREVKDTQIDFEALNLKTSVLPGKIEFTPKLKDARDSDATIKVVVKKGKTELKLGEDLIEENGKYSFTAAAGEKYTIVMSAEDASGNTVVTSGHVLTVVSDDNSAPEVDDFTANKSVALKDDVISFTLPKATDTIENNLKYEVAVEGVSTLTYKDSEGNTKTDLTAKPLQAGDIVEFAMPNQDAKITVSVKDSKNTTQKTYTVKLKDSVAPTLTINATDAFDSYKQDEEAILIPKITITDSNVFSVSVNYNLTIDGVDYSNTIYGGNRTYKSATELDIENVKFVAATAGQAVLTVSVVDEANNIIANVYKFEIASTLNTVFSIGKVPTEAKVYEKIALPEPNFKDRTDLSYYVVATGEDIPSYDIANEGGKFYFIAKAPGTFVLEYVVVNASTYQEVERSVPYTITATDSDAPTFTLDSSIPVPTQVPFETDTTSKNVDLPAFAEVRDGGSSLNVKSYKLTVKDTDGSEYSVEFDNVKKTFKETESAVLKYDQANNKFVLKVDQNGTYTFKYEVVDFNGNVASIDTAKEVNGEMKLIVGDIEPPTIDASELNIKTSYKEGESFVANIEDLQLTDDQKDGMKTALEEYKDKNLTVELYNGSTKINIKVDELTGDITIDDENYANGKLAVGDNYRLVLTAKDDAGNKSPITYNISVKAKEVESVSHEKVWGIVLICISVAVLGAVVVYFIATREKTAPKNDKKENEKAGDKPEQE